MKRRELPGLDLQAVLQAREGGEGGGPQKGMPAEDLLALVVGAPSSTTTPIAAAEAVRTDLLHRERLDTSERQLLIAADLITGRVAQAGRRIEELAPPDRVSLDRFLSLVWGVGRAPLPPDLERASGRKARPDHRANGGHGVAWITKVCTRSRHAWRVVRAADRLHFGSAAVVNGAWFSAELAQRSLVLTCSHVCSELPAGVDEPTPVAPDQAAVDWSDDEGPWVDSSGQPGLAKVKRVVWESRDLFDAVLLEVDDLPEWALVRERAPTAEVAKGKRIYLWSYPEDNPVWLSNEDNEIVDVEVDTEDETRRLLQFSYDAFAESGSSGAPVFDSESHQLLGLHRSEHIDTERRRAVKFELILRAARKQLA